MWDIWKNWALLDDAHLVLNELNRCGYLDQYPILTAMQNVPQDSVFHPEGDVWTHSLLTVSEVIKICKREKEDEEKCTILVMSALLHDCGKPSTTLRKGGRVISPGHAQVGAVLANDFLTQIGCPERIAEVIVSLVDTHMEHVGFRGSKRHVRRLLQKVDLNLLKWLVEADISARPPLPAEMPATMLHILQVASALEVTIDRADQQTLLSGDEIMNVLGIPQGKQVGIVKQQLAQAVRLGQVKTKKEAYEWLKTGV